MKSFLDFITKVEKVVAAITVFSLTALIVSDIFSRELLNSGLAWAQKSAVYFMIWAGFLGASLASSHGAHLRPEIADKLWPEKSKNLFFGLQNFFIATFCIAGSYFGYNYLQESIELGDSDPILGLPLWIVQIIIPITFLLMGFKHSVYAFNKDLRPVKKGFH